MITPTVRTITTVTLRKHFAGHINMVRYRNVRLILTRRDVPLAIILGFEDWQRIRRLIEREEKQ